MSIKGAGLGLHRTLEGNLRMSRTAALRALTGLATSLILALGGVAGLATSAEASKPTTPKPPKPPKGSGVAITATVTDTGADFSIIASVSVGDIEDVDCTVDGRDVQCSEPVALGKSKSTFTGTVTNLPPTDHLFEVTVTTSRKAARGSFAFATTGAQLTFEQACAEYGGTIFGTSGPFADSCFKEYGTHAAAEADFDNFAAALRPSCPPDAYSSFGLGAEETALDFACANEANQEMRALCESVGGGGTTGLDVVSCNTTDVSIAAEYEDICVGTGGYYFFDDSFETASLVCLAELIDPESACSFVGGSYAAASLLSWTCTKTYDTVENRDADFPEFTNGVEVACDPSSPFDVETGELSHTYVCGTSLAAELNTLCGAASPVSSGLSPTTFGCQTGDVTLAGPFEATCVAAGAAYRADETTTPTTYVCKDVIGIS